MDITLVSEAGSEAVHGTDNDKKTGCGINLLKPENVTRYRRVGMMTDLKEITCQKCKASLAKKIIKADKKEMARLLKEEKQREKMGIADEGIVPLGNTTAKITGSQPKKEEAPAPRQEAPVQQNTAYNQPEAASESVTDNANSQKFIPGTGVAMDDDLAAFAISKPQEEEPETPAAEDDFLAQFAIQKPQEEPEESAEENAQDDFLAQFAIPVTGVQQPQAESSYEEPDEMNELEIPEDISHTSIPSAYSSEPASQMQSEDDIMKMFSIEQDETPNQTPVQSVYENDESVIDITDDEISPYTETPAEPEYTEEAPVQPSYEAEVAEETETDLSGMSEWDMVANQIFGFEGVQQTAAAPSVPVQEGPAEMEELPIPSADEKIASAEHSAVPELDDIVPAQQTEAVEPENVYEEAEEVEDVQPAAPVIEEVAPIQQTAPVLDDIASAIAMASAIPKAPKPVQQTAPVIEEIAPAPQPVQQTAPVIEEIAPAPQPVQQTAPVIEEIAPAPQPVQQTAPVLDDIASAIAMASAVPKAPAPVQQTAPVQETAPAPQAAPVLDDIASAIAMASAVPKAPAPAPVPVITNAQTAPVQPAAPVNTAPAPNAAANGNTDDMKKYSVPAYADELPKKPAAAQVSQPQIINVPQFAGYDQNGQPIYSYVQMILTGYDQNGQPIFAPIQGQNGAPAVPPVPQAAPAMPQNMPGMAQTIAPVQPNMQPAAPTQSEPQRVSIAVAAARAAEEAAQANGPTANVSKIAVNPHSRSTSQAFINAISSSKGYADKNLIETQGLRANSPVLNSIEDVLSTMGDDSLKRKQQAAAQQAVPKFEEYRTPQRKTSYSSSSSPSASKPQEKDPRFMTKAELKAKKKQDKIDAKFKKDMAKRGF